MTGEIFQAADPRPRPAPTLTTLPFWTAAREGRLEIQRCCQCGDFVFYPRERCPQCGSAALEWQEIEGAGVVYSFTVARRPTHRLLTSRVPYVVAMVELAVGPRMTSALLGVEPDDVRIGMPVTVAFEADDEFTYPVFVPAQPARQEDS
jgi:hypothetical protein